MDDKMINGQQTQTRRVPSGAGFTQAEQELQLNASVSANEPIVGFYL